MIAANIIPLSSLNSPKRQPSNIKTPCLINKKCYHGPVFMVACRGVKYEKEI